MHRRTARAISIVQHQPSVLGDGKRCANRLNTEMPRIISLLCLSLLCGCAEEVNQKLQENATDSKLHLSSYADRDNFEPRVLQFVDADTAKPISKIRVNVVCMGQTPYADSKDITDDNGNATIFGWKGGGIAIRVEHPDYEPMTILAAQGTQILKLVKPIDSIKK